MEAQELPGDDKRSHVRWIKPVPSCPSKPDSNNPQSASGRYPVGESTVTYKYTIGGSYNKKDIECPVHIDVPGELFFKLGKQMAGP